MEKKGDYAIMRDKIISIAKSALKSNERNGTWYYKLQRKDNKLWAICFAWMDYENNDEWNLYGKVAYQPTNFLLQCDYDVDWLYPITDEGECDVAETPITETNIELCIDWLLENWERMQREYIQDEND